MRVAFDIDDTLWKVRARKIRDGDCVYGCEHNNHHCGNYSFDQIPDYNLVPLLMWFCANGEEVYAWSAGGISYAQDVLIKLGLDGYVHNVIEKSKASAEKYGIDLSFDDQEVTLARVNVRVKR